jgi:endoglucanase
MRSGIRRMPRVLALAAAGALAAAAALAIGGGPVTAAGTAPSLHVSGNHLVDASGNTVVLHGVNRSGGEFACVQGNGIWDGPMDQASVDAITSWQGVNAVRVPLNEACWNGESYVDSQYSGTAYRQAVEDYVNLLNANGLVAIMDLHWTDGTYTGNSSACSVATATCQKPMPDAAQAVPFWTSMAQTFGGNDAVVFDLFNEPYPERATGDETSGWQCWRDGGTCAGIGYQVAGMQTLVDAVRGTGADNVIMLGGLAYSNDLTQWLAYEPSDPDGNLVASHHSYNFNTCSSQSCWDSQLAPVAAQVPLVVGELGENDCGHGYIDTLMNWLDSHDLGYLAWTWNNWDCSSGPSLISDYTGTPTAYGQGYKDHLAALQNGGGGSTPPPTGTCSAAYHVDNDWGSGFTATVTVTNGGGAAISSWAVSWSFGGNQQVSNAWNASLSQSGTAVTARNAGYNGSVAAGQSTSFGFQASYTGSNSAPTLNCTA